MCALASPFEVFLDLQELIVLSEGLKHGEAKDCSSMSNGVFALDFLEVTQVVRVSSALCLQDKVVDSVGKLSTDDVREHFPLSLKLRLNRNSIEHFFIKAVDLAHFES